MAGKRQLIAILLLITFIGCSWAIKVEEKVQPTSGVAEITRITNEDIPMLYPKPSPDSKNILISTRDTSKRGDEQWSIVSVRLDSPGKELVTGSHSLNPSWFPDGNAFVYEYTKSEKSRLVRSGKGSAITYVSAAPLGDADGAPDIHPDGNKIAFHTFVGDEWMIATVELDGTLFTLLCPGLFPKWSPNGSHLLFFRRTAKYFHIFTFNMQSGQVTQLTEGKHNNIHPYWAPDGIWLAFSSDREDNRLHIFIMNKYGDSITRLTTGQTDEILPAWSSDGYIYFCSNAGGKSISKSESNVLPSTWDYSNIWRIKPNLDVN